ncbi:MAG TPA: response regulator transcription factor [Verrucomicrobiae bacterium]|jgi:DNA-binding NarL/FixJ family response regulator|nr:response regulator transcription factor [Verrucomicrobiae bacterium]
MTREVKVLIVDDHAVFRRGLREVIEENPRFRIVGEAPDGEAALRLIPELKPRVAIVDIDMPRLNGLEMVRALRKTSLSVLTIFLTMYRDEEMFNAAMDLGVKAYVLKDSATDDILAALAQVADGGSFVSPSMSDLGKRREHRVQELLLSKPQIDELTPAERHILKLIAEDRTSKEIAGLLNISSKTVENHRSNICHKLKLYGSHSLLKFAFDHKSSL